MSSDLSHLHDRVLHNSSEFWMVFDRVGTPMHYGPTLERRLGWTPDVLGERTLMDMVHREDRDTLIQQLSHVIAHRGAIIRIEFRLLHARGSWLNVDATFTNCLGDAGIDGLLLQAEDITRFKLAQDALRFAEEKYRSIFENAVEGIFQASPEGQFMSANPALARILGYDGPVQLIHAVRDIGKELCVEPALRAHYLEQLECRGELRGFESRMRRRDGREIWISENVRVVRAPTGKVMWYEGTIEDITNQKLALEALRISEERYALAASGSNGGLWEWDLLSNRVYWSARWLGLLGFAEGELSDSPNEWLDRVHDRDLELVKRELEDHLQGNAPYFEAEFRMQRQDASYCWFLSRGMASRDHNGVPVRIAGSMEEISARKKAEEQLMEGALYDVLTGFPNRALFLDRVRRSLVRARKTGSDQYVGILYLDMDRFKMVNDSLGHEAGDDLILAVGRLIEESLLPRDTLARLGGDEFAILMEGYTDINTFSRMAEKIQALLAQPVLVRGQEIFTSMSVGISISESLNENPDDLLRDAETAMFRAKDQGKGQNVVFNQDMHEFSLAHLEMETNLRRAVERDEFKVFYQPILELSTGRVAGFEALVRWLHPEKGIVSPVVFIPLAEETGLIVEIGRQVLYESCRQLAEWRQANPHAHNTFVSVNLSVRQFVLPDIVEQVRRILLETGLPGHALKLEITESVILDTSSVAAEKVRELKAQGIELSIDDFGTGYSSLSYLHQFPFDNLKVDRSFVMRMGETPERSAIVRTIVQLAHNLGMDAVAEGIETVSQAAGLRSLECRYGQGFLFSKPVPAVDATLLVGKVYPLPEPM